MRVDRIIVQELKDKGINIGKITTNLILKVGVTSQRNLLLR